MEKHTTRLRFSIRSLLFTVAGIALYCGLVVPFARDWEARRLIHFGGLLFAGFAGAGIAAVRPIRHRYAIEQKNGHALVVIDCSAQWPTRSLARSNVIIACCIGATAFFGSSAILINSSSQPQLRLIWMLSQYVMCFVFGMNLGLNIVHKWLGGLSTLEINEKGMVVNGIGQHLWTDFRALRWSPHNGTLRMVIKLWSTDIFVPVQQRDEVSAVLDRFAAQIYVLVPESNESGRAK